MELFALIITSFLRASIGKDTVVAPHFTGWGVFCFFILFNLPDIAGKTSAHFAEIRAGLPNTTLSEAQFL